MAILEKQQAYNVADQEYEQKLQQRDRVIGLKDTIIAQLNQQLLHKEKALQHKDTLLQKIGQQLQQVSETA